MKLRSLLQSRVGAELLVLLGLLVIASMMLLRGVASFPGGLHWENYDFAFMAALSARHPGFTGTAEVWDTLQEHFGWAGLQCALSRLGLLLHHSGWGTLGIVKTTASFAVAVTLATYLCARSFLDRRTALLSAFFLLVCPAFLFHARAGNFQPILNALFPLLAIALFIRGAVRHKPVLLMLSAYPFSLMYLAGYVAFPMVLFAVALSLAAHLLIHRRMLSSTPQIALWVLLIIAFVLLNGAVLSVLYCQQDPFYLIRSIEAKDMGILKFLRPMFGGRASQSEIHLVWNGTNQLNNAAWFAREFFWQAGPTFKEYVPPGRSAALLPFDHLGSTLPGTPGIYPPVVFLSIVGVCVAGFRKRLPLFLLSLLTLITIASVTLITSYHGRRLVFLLPYACILAASGYVFLENILPAQRRVLRDVTLGALLACLFHWAIRDLHGQLPKHLQTLQFNAYREAGQWLKANLNPQRDLLVLLDKSVMFPSAVYCETDLQPWRILVVSEIYYPLLGYQPPSPQQCLLLAAPKARGGKSRGVPVPGLLVSLPTDPYELNPWQIEAYFRYCNVSFGNILFDYPEEARAAVFDRFRTALVRQMLLGRTPYLLCSLADDSRVESGSARLTQFLLSELIRRGVSLQFVAALGTYRAGQPAIAVCRILNVPMQ